MRRVRPLLAGLALTLAPALCLLLWAASGHALPVIDQDSGPATAEVWCDNDCDLQQTFTVGASGQLAQLDVWLNRAPDTGMALVIAGQVMTALSPFSGFTGQLSLDLSPLNLYVLAGDTVTFDFEHDDVLVLQASQAAYARGDLTFICHFDGCINPLGPTQPAIDGYPFPVVVDLNPTDIAFRTFVIPEPSSLLLLGAATLALGATRRRRSS